MSALIWCYDLAGDCCRLGVWWVEPPWVIRHGSRLWVRARAVGRRYRYEEVCG